MKFNSNLSFDNLIFISIPFVVNDIYSLTEPSKLECIFKLNPLINNSILEENSKSFGINFSSESLLPCGVSFSSGVGVGVGVVGVGVLSLLLIFDFCSFISFSLSFLVFFSFFS